MGTKREILYALVILYAKREILYASQEYIIGCLVRKILIGLS